MENVCLLGIDFGSKRVGTAISHGFMAEAYKTLDYTKKENFYKDLTGIIDEQKIQKLVVGLPLLDGRETAQTKWTIAQVDELKDKINIPVEFVDEAYSSVEADKYASDRDSESARIILEQYLAS